MTVIQSHCKINIGLRIVGKRADGYHNLESVFQETTFGDELFIRKKDRGVKILASDDKVPRDERNLCFQAFLLLKKEFGLRDGLEIEILKNIPMGSGLGGGSSNAAACLLAINALFHLGLTRPQLLRLAAGLGSDVPFFILGKTALVKGRGEVVIPMQFLKEYSILIVVPDLHISTPFIYKNFEMGLTKYSPGIKFEAVVSEVQTLGELKEFFFNDLEGVAKQYHPELAEIHQLLADSGAEFVSMSGSGSAMFGLYREGTDVQVIKDNIPQKYKSFIAKPVT